MGYIPSPRIPPTDNDRKAISASQYVEIQAVRRVPIFSPGYPQTVGEGPADVRPAVNHIGPALFQSYQYTYFDYLKDGFNYHAADLQNPGIAIEPVPTTAYSNEDAGQYWWTSLPY